MVDKKVERFNGADFEDGLLRIFNFFETPLFENINASLIQKHRRFLIAQRLLDNKYKYGTVQISLMMFILSIFRNQAVIPGPSNGMIFCFGDSLTNIQAMQRVAASVEIPTKHPVVFNGEPVPILDRFKGLLIGYSKLNSVASFIRKHKPNFFTLVQLLLYCVSFVTFKHIFRSEKPALCMIANDHSPETMGLAFVCKHFGIPVAYAQHAPVSLSFPPLIFSVSFLCNQLSYSIYERINKKSGISIGPVSIIQEISKKEGPGFIFVNPVSRVGISLGAEVNFAQLMELVNFLCTKRSVTEIIIRPHPRFSFNFSGLINLSPMKIRVSTQIEESFFEEIDCLFVGNSGLAYQALSWGIPCLYVDGLDPYPYDYYGYLSTRLMTPWMPNRPINAQLKNFYGSEIYKERYLDVFKGEKEFKKESHLELSLLLE